MNEIVICHFINKNVSSTSENFFERTIKILAANLVAFFYNMFCGTGLLIIWCTSKVVSTHEITTSISRISVEYGRRILSVPYHIWTVMYLTIILRNRAEYRLILSRRGCRPSWLKSGDIPQD